MNCIVCVRECLCMFVNVKWKLAVCMCIYILVVLCLFHYINWHVALKIPLTCWIFFFNYRWIHSTIYRAYVLYAYMHMNPAGLGQENHLNVFSELSEWERGRQTDKVWYRECSVLWPMSGKRDTLKMRDG